MGIVYPQAQLSPAKIEIVREWLSRRSWFDLDPETVVTRRRFGYRFDDPAGAVGVESVLVETGDAVFQVPMTYRSAALPGAEDHFLATMEHSALGTRWIHFGLGDPVAVRAFVTAIVEGGSSVDVEFERDGETTTLAMLVGARGTGSGTAPADLRIESVEAEGPVASVVTASGTLSMPIRIDTAAAGDGAALLGAWDDATDVPLASWEPVESA
ncbi:MAG: hypothetical protein QM809_06395 [Gordonia sp. (in: high G+C Gram-positive bacteria)]|uniref:maltokinase N-terminal cap-like domain-containing protein n=1 Tax=Gordonia sp. (in: high G+C Gram-positive bacteria) TaxID=84139 RepID=UPI0039E2E8B0